jgi:cell division protein FtsI/penicillin-binding protein 2
MRRRRAWSSVAAPAPPHHYGRLLCLMGLLVVAFGVVIWRLVDLQLWRSVELSERAERQREVQGQHSPMRPWTGVEVRGRIIDRNGTTLAQSVPVKTVKADPSLVGERYAGVVAAALAGPLRMEERVLADLLSRDRRTNAMGEVRVNRYVMLKRHVPLADWAAARAALSGLDLEQDDEGLSEEERRRRQRAKWALVRAIQCEEQDEQVREYPGGTLAAHLLGFVPFHDEASRGAEGLEASLDSILRGVAGEQRVQEVRRGDRRFLKPMEGWEARPGLNVVLTVDAALQRIAEEALDTAWVTVRPAAITCVVIRPRTGEILAMANRPTFDPNRYGEAKDSERRNRAITDPHEPGSTMKVLSMAGAIEAGVAALSDRIDCQGGRAVFFGKVLTDHQPNGVLTLEEVIAKSSNVGVAKVGFRMSEVLGRGSMEQMVRRFGLGQRTGIPLPGEADGVVNPANRWSGLSAGWIAFGYEVAATPLQMTMAVGALANEGRLMRPLLVRRIEDDLGREVLSVGPQDVRQAVSAATARRMTQAMVKAVEEGTGMRARLEDYTVAGKTGTARRSAGGGYARDRHFASFIGFLPAEEPELVVGVFVYEPREGMYGSQTAAPVFREIAGRSAAYLGISPSPVRGLERSGSLAQRDGGVVRREVGGERRM